MTRYEQSLVLAACVVRAAWAVSEVLTNGHDAGRVAESRYYAMRAAVLASRADVAMSYALFDSSSPVGDC